MIKTFKKGLDEVLSREYSSTDFDCKCDRKACETTLIDLDLIAPLDHLADLFARIRINSGFRCQAHNKEVGGKIDSYHLKGQAVDISSMFASPRELKAVAENLTLFLNGGIGLYTNFVHLDTRGHLARW